MNPRNPYEVDDTEPGCVDCDGEASCVIYRRDATGLKRRVPICHECLEACGLEDDPRDDGGQAFDIAREGVA